MSVALSIKRCQAQKAGSKCPFLVYFLFGQTVSVLNTRNVQFHVAQTSFTTSVWDLVASSGVAADCKILVSPLSLLPSVKPQGPQSTQLRLHSISAVRCQQSLLNHRHIGLLRQHQRTLASLVRKLHIVLCLCHYYEKKRADKLAMEGHRYLI